MIRDFRSWGLDVLSVVSVIYLAFHLFWGMNYYRVPLHQTLELNDTYTTEELIAVTEKLIAKSNAIHNRISAHDSLKIEMPYTRRELLNRTPEGYKALARSFPQLDYHPSSVKHSIYSLPLTYMGFSGYLNPFTNEAQVNSIIPTHKYPTTASHEEAHQLGYGAENETNFLGCLASIHHNDIYFNYSGYIFALRHCLNEIYQRDETVYESLVESINKGIIGNYKESYQLWQSYQNPLEPIFKNTYNVFLKANNQDKGIESYSYAVALFVDYFKEKSD